MTTPNPLALWAALSPTQREELRITRSFGHSAAGRRNRSWCALHALGLAERRGSGVSCRWYLTPLGAQVARPAVCFLDMDGVCARVIPDASAIERIDPAAVARLNRIHAATGCDFVSSSTWREGRAPALAASIISGWLRMMGFAGKVVDATPVIGDAHRPAEIEAWLRSQAVPPRAFAILDDWPMHHLAHRAVQTNHDLLLTDADAERAIALLSPPAGTARARGQRAADAAGSTP